MAILVTPVWSRLSGHAGSLTAACENRSFRAGSHPVFLAGALRPNYPSGMRLRSEASDRSLNRQLSATAQSFGQKRDENDKSTQGTEFREIFDKGQHGTTLKPVLYTLYSSFVLNQARFLACTRLHPRSLRLQRAIFEANHDVTSDETEVHVLSPC
ncbi:MAG: hypothetical protein WCF20_13025 [Methylovirgula sp.]